MKAFQLCVSVALATLSVLGWCNDTAVVGIGGVIKPMENHPSIVLRSHVVKVKITPEYADVDCTFVLHNTGKATRVLIGFPESGGGDIVVPKMGFEYFRSYVDGKRVQVRVQEQRRESGPDGYFRWYLKRVRFGAGQTRVIRNVYRAPLGAISTGHDFFDYILTTGASWKGKIGRSDIIVELSGLDHVVDLEIRPEGYRRVGNRIVWRLENYEPKENIYIVFFQHYRLLVNDDQLGASRIVSRNAVQRPQGVFLIEARWFEAIPGVRVAWDGSQQRITITDSSSGRQIVMRVGDRWAIVNGQRVQLPVAPSWYHEWGRRVVRVPLRSVVEALGGQVAFKRESATVEVQFPNRSRAKKTHNHARLAGEPPSVALRCTRAANRAYLTLPQQLSLALTVSGNTNCTAKVHNCPPPAGSPREAGGTAQELGSPCLQGEPKVGGRQLLFFVKFGSAIGKCLCSEI